MTLKRILSPLLLLYLGVIACRKTEEPIPVQSWGSMRQVLHHGHTQGRVRIDEFGADRSVIAVGALEGLAGEVLILDGNVWVSRVLGDGALETTHSVPPHTSATLLTLARVSEWQSRPVQTPVSASQSEALLIEAAHAAGFDLRSPVPFKAVGPLNELEFHVIAGSCPNAPGQGVGHDPVRPPFRRSCDKAVGTLVGFLVLSREGTLTHHGSAMHTHVILSDEPIVMGHVDQVGFGAGTVVFFPTQAPPQKRLRGVVAQMTNQEPHGSEDDSIHQHNPTR